jgi:hypothetical protein
VPSVVLASLTGCTPTQHGDFYNRDPVRPHLASPYEETADSLVRGLTGPPGQAVGQLQPSSALRELAVREILHYQREPVPLQQQAYDSARRDVDSSQGNPFAAVSMLVSLAVLPAAGDAQLDVEWFQQAALGSARAVLEPAPNSPGPGQVEWTAVLKLADAAAATSRPAIADQLRGLLRDALAPRADQVCRNDRSTAERDASGHGEPGYDADVQELVREAAVIRLHRGTGLCAPPSGATADRLGSVVERHCAATTSDKPDLFNAIELAQAHRDLASDPTDHRCADVLRQVLDSTLRSRQLMSDDSSVPLHAVLLAHRTLDAGGVSPFPLPEMVRARVHAAAALAGAPADSSQPVAFTEAVLGSVTSAWLDAAPVTLAPAQLRHLATELADIRGVDAALTRALAALTEPGAQRAVGLAQQVLADPGASADARLTAHLERALPAAVDQRNCELLDVQGLRREAAKVAGEVAQGGMLQTVQLVIWFTALAHQPTACASLRDAADHAATLITDAAAVLGRNTTPEVTRIHHLLGQWRDGEKACRQAQATPTDATLPVLGFLTDPPETRATLASTANTLGLGPLSLTYLAMRVQRLAEAGCGHPLLAWFIHNAGTT